jgi:excisionase family DNA binding protein
MPQATDAKVRQQARSPVNVDPICLRIPDACRFLGIGRSKLYVLIASGDIEVVKMGSSTLVMTESLRALIESRRLP